MEGNGVISVRELEQVVQQEGLGNLQDDVVRLLQGIDIDGSNTLNYREFLAATMEVRPFPPRGCPWFLPPPPPSPEDDASELVGRASMCRSLWPPAPTFAVPFFRPVGFWSPGTLVFLAWSSGVSIGVVSLAIHLHPSVRDDAAERCVVRSDVLLPSDRPLRCGGWRRSVTVGRAFPRRAMICGWDSVGRSWVGSLFLARGLRVLSTLRRDSR